MVIDHSKKLFLSVSAAAILVVAIAIIFLGIRYVSNQNKQDSKDRDLSAESVEVQKEAEDQLALIEQKLPQFVDAENEEAGKITSIDDLAALPRDSQGNVGIIIIRQAVETGDKEKANQYIDFVMQEDTAKAIEAGLLCYQIAETDSRRDGCVARLNELARSQGIIEQDQTLPPEYYQEQEKEIG